VKRKYWILLVLVVAVLVLSGCGVPREGVDVYKVPASGLWQTLVVWPLAKSLLWLHTWLEKAGVPYHWGFAIIVFTLIIKIITFPLTVSQMRGMQAQKDMQPKIQELQRKYGKDREKLAQEQMKLYKEAGVNPVSGCLPLVIQMPVLFGLYAALVTLGHALNKANFFWIPDLGFPQYTHGITWVTDAFKAGNYGLLASYLILPILLVASQFVMQKWMTPTAAPASGDSQAKMMQQMSLMMTFMFGFFTLQVPSGLTLYWVTSNLLQMLQQWLVTSSRFNFVGASKAGNVTIDVPRSTKPGNNGESASNSSNNLETDDIEGATSKKSATPQAKRRREKRK
jgi:YidC/Oxa1 family membrane protein insertase